MSLNERTVPLPPVSEGLQRIIDEPWRRRSQGVRRTRVVPNIVTRPVVESEVDDGS